MKYVVLIYSNPRTWETLPEAERARVLGIHDRLLGEMRESGELLRVDGLTDPTDDEDDPLARRPPGRDRRSVR